MSATYLDGIVAYHRERAAHDTRHWRERAVRVSPGPSLYDALVEHRSAGIAVVAEVKRRSPSKGWLARDLDAAATARAYVAGGATAISVLTDEPHFGGSLADLRAVVDEVEVPVLRKDFVVAPNDVVDAAEAGAAAVLLIVAALETVELAELLEVVRDVGLDAVVEVHTGPEASAAVDLGARLVGVNQRDLHSFTVDPQRAEAVVAMLPRDVVAIAESGFHDPVAVARAAAAGFDAVLVGERFVTADDPAREVRSFVGAPIGERSP
jgi:indole-3-glycerol phosphate synthase